MATLKKRVTVVFSFKRYRRLGDFKYKVGSIGKNISDNSGIFSTPVPTVLIVTGHIATMDAEQLRVKQRIPGAVGARNIAFNVVADDVRAWKRYVQGLIDAAPSYEAAIEIAQASGFDIKVNGVFLKPPLRIMLTPNPSTIKLIAASAGKKAAYAWSMSANNGVSWTELPVTNVANTLVTGLAAGPKYSFRFRSTVKNVVSAWSSSVHIVIQYPVV